MELFDLLSRGQNPRFRRTYCKFGAASLGCNLSSIISSCVKYWEYGIRSEYGRGAGERMTVTRIKTDEYLSELDRLLSEPLSGVRDRENSAFDKLLAECGNPRSDPSHSLEVEVTCLSLAFSVMAIGGRTSLGISGAWMAVRSQASAIRALRPGSGFSLLIPACRCIPIRRN
jgi:hypothetical protein